MNEQLGKRYGIACLERFLDSFKDENIDIITVINKTGVRLLTIDYQKNIDKRYCAISAAIKMKQIQRYLAMRKAIQEMQKGCEEKQVEPVFMKGLLLALDIYEDIGIRSSGDIDVLIEYERFSEFNHVLESLGYIHEFNNPFEQYNREFKNHHIRYHKKIDGIELLVEVHSSVINPVGLFQCEPKQFILSAREIEQFGIRVHVLGIEHELLALMLHFFKHLPTDYFQKIISQKDVFINISNLHDIALFIHKYGKMLTQKSIVSTSDSMCAEAHKIMVKY